MSFRYLLAAAAISLASCFQLQGLDQSAPPQNLVSDWRDEVVYQLMVDRFANGDPTNDYNVDLSNLQSYHGGDWQGIINHLDYLQGLGVTTVWISPVVKNVESDSGNDGYHGYWAQDFTAANPHFGDLSKLRELAQALHSRQMKLVLDIVANHVGQVFYYDINLNGKPDILIQGNGTTSGVKVVSEYDPDYQAGGIRAFSSAGDAGPAPIIFRHEPDTNHMPPVPATLACTDCYNKRGRVIDWNDAEQVVYGDFPGGLKDLNTLNPQVQQALIGVYEHWADLIDFDGFRIDTVKHVQHQFWQTFCQAIRDHQAARGKQQFVMFGEVFDGDDNNNAPFTQNNELDALVNFPAKYQVFEDLIKNNKYPTSKFQDFWTARANLYPAFSAPNGPSVPPINLPFNFLDNHDVPRYLSDAPSVDALKQALFLLMTMPGVPMIYYGTEQGFTGANDPANREDLSATNYDTTNDLYKWIAQLTTLRKNLTLLRRGSLEFRWLSSRQGSGEDVGIIAFTRSGDNGAVLVVMNTSDAGTSSTSFSGTSMTTGFDPNTTLVDQLTGTSYQVDANGNLQLNVLARQNLLLMPQ